MWESSATLFAIRSRSFGTLRAASLDGIDETEEI
jgi:hypothetical protein